jgi:pimeloyl-ACP methyl ester carboxylesterase/AraC-like DNA-binding protein
MTGLPDKLTQTPERDPMDILADLFSSLRLTGGVVVDGRLTGDFCLAAQFTPDECAPFFTPPEMLIGYHYIRSGCTIIQVESHEPVELSPGDIAILPRNDSHLLTNRIGLPPADSDSVSIVTEGGVHRIMTGSDGPATQMWCGVLGTQRANAHPIFEALPALLVLHTRDRAREWFDSSLRYLSEEQPSPAVLSRMAELFLAEAIREYLEQLPPDATGWIRGLTDPAVSRALSVIHSRYAEDLSIEMLAREAGVSRTVLGERFAELIGEPPMRYCARWRMRMAANLLREGKQNSANIAYSVGFNSEAAFNRAFKREYGEPPATWRRREESAALARSLAGRELPPQAIRYCTARDGTRLAFSVMGEGPPLVKTANWLNHLEFDWESPIWKHWLAELTDGRRLIRYDERGNGLSDWDTPELSLNAFVDDLETVVSAAGLETFDLLAISQGAAVAAAYAVRNPHRIRKMVLYGGFAAGWAVRGTKEELDRREAMLTLTQVGWGSDNPAYRQLFTNLYMPGATARQQKWFNELQKKSASPENAVRMQRALSLIDVRDLLGKVRTPTLVVHARGDQAVPFECSQELARNIPGARLVALEGQNHILLENEPAWPIFVREMRDFLVDSSTPELVQPMPVVAG